MYFKVLINSRWGLVHPSFVLLVSAVLLLLYSSQVSQHFSHIDWYEQTLKLLDQASCQCNYTNILHYHNINIRSCPPMLTDTRCSWHCMSLIPETDRERAVTGLVAALPFKLWICRVQLLSVWQTLPLARGEVSRPADPTRAYLKCNGWELRLDITKLFKSKAVSKPESFQHPYLIHIIFVARKSSVCHDNQSRILEGLRVIGQDNHHMARQIFKTQNKYYKDGGWRNICETAYASPTYPDDVTEDVSPAPKALPTL